MYAWVHSKWPSSTIYLLLGSHFAQELLLVAEGTAMKQVHILPPQEDRADRKMRKKKNYSDENLIGEFRE